MEKKCVTCGQAKTIEAFYPRVGTRDGRHAACKDCLKRYARDRYDKNRDSILGKARKDREENPAKYREYDRRFYENNKRSRSDDIRRRQKKDPRKEQARVKAKVMLKILDIDPVCVVCGDSSRVHAHHPDYDKPFDVIFLCSRHHRRLHYNDMQTVMFVSMIQPTNLIP